MNGLTNSIAGIAKKAPQGVLSAIRNASLKTGVDFSYMVQQAAAESSFNPTAKARSSSASGLYQFIESTWLSMVRDHGEKHGLGALAGKIDARGRVADKAARQEILALRNDPEIASHMAAEFAAENGKFLESHWAKGRKDVGATELYFAHFMGAGGAAAFLKARDENPLQQAALLFPKAAAANRNVFYDTKTGRPKTMDEVYAFFDRKFSVKDIALPEMQTAALEAPVSEAPVPAEPAPGAAEESQPAAYGQIAGDALIRSRVFTAERNLARFERLAAAPLPGAYQNLLRSPVDLMLLTQLEPPGGSKGKSRL